MIIHTYEKGGRTEACAGYLSELGEIPGIPEAVVLPIPTTRDSLVLRDTDIPLSDVVKRAVRGELVVGYGLPPSFVSELGRVGAVVYDAALDEDFLLENADLTAI